MEQNDLLHSKLQSEYIEECHINKNDPNELIKNIHSEYHYNYYGDRGFVDIIWFFNDWFVSRTGNIGEIFEIKTHLNNFGEGIRQLNKAAKCIPLTLGAITNKDKTFIKTLIVLFNADNAKIIYTNRSILENNKICLIWYFENHSKNHVIYTRNEVFNDFANQFYDNTTAGFYKKYPTFESYFVMIQQMELNSKVRK